MSFFLFPKECTYVLLLLWAFSHTDLYQKQIRSSIRNRPFPEPPETFTNVRFKQVQPILNGAWFGRRSAFSSFASESIFSVVFMFILWHYPIHDIRQSLCWFSVILSFDLNFSIIWMNWPLRILRNSICILPSCWGRFKKGYDRLCPGVLSQIILTQA